MKEMNNIYKVPDGYFDSLQKRLEAIPSQHTEERAPVVVMPLWTRVRPYVALAACMLMAFFIGNFFLGRNQPSKITLPPRQIHSLLKILVPWMKTMLPSQLRLVLI